MDTSRNNLDENNSSWGTNSTEQIPFVHQYNDSGSDSSSSQVASGHNQGFFNGGQLIDDEFTPSTIYDGSRESSMINIPLNIPLHHSGSDTSTSVPAVNASVSFGNSNSVLANTSTVLSGQLQAQSPNVSGPEGASESASPRSPKPLVASGQVNRVAGVTPSPTKSTKSRGHSSPSRSAAGSENRSNKSLSAASGRRDRSASRRSESNASQYGGDPFPNASFRSDEIVATSADNMPFWMQNQNLRTELTMRGDLIKILQRDVEQLQQTLEKAEARAKEDRVTAKEALDKMEARLEKMEARAKEDLEKMEARAKEDLEKMEARAKEDRVAAKEALEKAEARAREDRDMVREDKKGMQRTIDLLTDMLKAVQSR